MFNTVAAISTAPGASAINILRITGKNAVAVAEKIFKPDKLKSLSCAQHSMMYLGKILTDSVTDKAFAVCFFAPKSYTGEDLVELQCHGGYWIANVVLNALLEAGASPASKGEFTKRAFLNGKLSLADAEAISDMITAESSSALCASARQATGELTRAINALTRDVENTIAELEASMDYPDEMADQVTGNADFFISSVTSRLDTLILSYNTGQVLKHGLTVAIIGLPNVGKSSLLNRLTKSERSIVSKIPGTTRDIIEEKIEINGVAVTLLDTAGIRKTDSESEDSEIENIGIKKAIAASKSVDMVLFVTEFGRDLTAAEKELLNDLQSKHIILIANKCDLVSRETESKQTGILPVSALSGDGIDGITAAISNILNAGTVDTAGALVTNKRHFAALLRARDASTKAASGLYSMPTECTVEDLRECYRALGEITGDTATENIINAVFERFCVGK